MELSLTIPEFVMPLQAIILTRRYESKDEEDRQDWASAYRQAATICRGRELRAEATVQVLGVTIRLSTMRIYEHEGNLVRIVFLTERGMAARYDIGGQNVLSKTRDRLVLNISRWILVRKFATAPRSMVTIYHVFDDDHRHVRDEIVHESLMDDAAVESWIKGRVVKLARSLSLGDDQLEGCTAEERWSSPKGKNIHCVGFCPARHRCVERARFFEQESAKADAFEAAIRGG